jgi:hypothetical protein
MDKLQSELIQIIDKKFLGVPLRKTGEIILRFILTKKTDRYQYFGFLTN